MALRLQTKPRVGWLSFLLDGKLAELNMNDVLSGFETALKSLYPNDHPKLCKFAEEISPAVSAVQATFEENEFPKFMAKLDHYRGISGRAELILGWETRNVLAAQVCPSQGLTLMDIGQHRFIFVSLDGDGGRTCIFWRGRQVGIFRRRSFGESFIGGSLPLLNPDEQVMASFTFPNLLASMGNRPSWPRIRVRYPNESITLAFPNAWPNPGGGISEQLVSDFSLIPFERQALTIAVLLWSNNSL